MSVPLVVLPGSGQLVAPDARAWVCLKQAFAFPGQITVIVEGKKTLTLTQLPALVPSGVQLSEFQGLRSHTCEVVDGRLAVRVRVIPLAAAQGLLSRAS